MVPAPDEDVLRLHVAVDEAGLVRRVERVGDGEQDGDRALRRELAGAHEPLEVGAADEPHRDEQPAVELARLVDADDVVVLDRGLEAGLAPEAVAEPAVLGEVAGQQLEGDRAAQRQLHGLIDDSHAAAAEHGFDAVASDLRTGGEQGRPILPRQVHWDKMDVRPACRPETGAQTPSIERPHFVQPWKPVFQP